MVGKAPPGDCPLVLAMERPVGWLELVKDPQTDAELASVRHSVERGRPFGSDNWVKRMAETLGLESSLRPRGRPNKCSKQ